MINWPVIIKHDGEDELIYVSSFTEWVNDEEMLLYIFTDRDVLIDRLGQVYSLTDVQKTIATNGDIEPGIPLATASVDNVMELVRAHASLMGSCCIEKLHAASVEEALAIVSQLQN